MKTCREVQQNAGKAAKAGNSVVGRPVLADRNAMLIASGNAMQAYASFEFGLFNLLDILLNTRRESAAAVFYLGIISLT